MKYSKTLYPFLCITLLASCTTKNQNQQSSFDLPFNTIETGDRTREMLLMPDGSYLWIHLEKGEDGEKEITGFGYMVDGRDLVVSHDINDEKLLISTPPFDSYSIYERSGDGYILVPKAEALRLMQPRESGSRHESTHVTRPKSENHLHH